MASIRGVLRDGGRCVALVALATILGSCGGGPDPAAEGFPCNPDGSCSLGLVCLEGRCLRSEPNPGCEDDEDCEDLPCLRGVCVEGRCESVVEADGQGCGAGAVCVEGECSRGCFLEGRFVAPDTTDETSPCLGCQPELDTSRWSVLCNEGYTCHDGECVPGCAVEGELLSPGERHAELGCLHCDPAVDVTGWSDDCPAGKVCDLGGCATGCIIDGGFRLPGAPHPTDPCLHCDPNQAPRRWSFVPESVSCDDGLLCTVETTCDGAGNCGGGQPRDCGHLDGICVVGGCDGEVEAGCVEVFLPNGTPCGDGLLCDGAGGCIEDPLRTTVRVEPAGNGAGRVSSAPAGIDCGAACSASFERGGEVTLFAEADEESSEFAGWTGACSGTSQICRVTAEAAPSVGATFVLRRHELSVAIVGNGGGLVVSDPAGLECDADCEQAFDHGTNVVLSAMPRGDSEFLGWSGACSGSDACEVTIIELASVTATFRLRSWNLTVAGSGEGEGRIVSQPVGVDCGASCEHAFEHGTSVTLTATPSAEDSVFAGWAGACAGSGAVCSLQMTQARSTSARFDVRYHALTVTRTGAGSGSVVAGEGSIDCGSVCSHHYRHGSRVTLTAAASTGSSFGGWTGACSGQDVSCTVTVDQARNVTATFDRILHSLVVTQPGNGSGTVTSSPAGIDCGSVCDAPFPFNEVVTLTAQTASSSVFESWGGACAGTSTTCTVTMSQSRSASARFTLKRYDLTVTKSGTGGGSVTSAPSGIDCGSSCKTTFDHGTSVTLVASPASGSRFVGWSGSGCSGTGTCTVSMSQARSVTAEFVRRFDLTVSKSGSGSGTVTSNPSGISCGSTCSTTYDDNTSVTLTASAASGSRFVGWSGSGCSGTGTCTVTMSQARTVTAEFTRRFDLTVSKSGSGSGTVTSNPSGISCGSSCSTTYDDNTSVTLTASAASGSRFVGWTGSGCSGTGTCTVTMSQARSVTAEFTRRFDLTVGKSGSGSGTVTSSPSGINCGSTCSATYDDNTSVTLTASAASGSRFVGWSGSGCSGTGTCTVTMSQARSVTATFTRRYTLTVSKSGSGSGTVTSSPSGISCGSTCSTSYDDNTSVTLTASAASGDRFVGWSGSGCSGTGTCTVTMSQARTVTAAFTKRYTLTVSRSGSGTVNSSPSGISCGSTCSASYDDGTQVTLTASPSSGNAFTGWSGSGCSGTGSCTVTMSQARSVTATFASLATLSVTVSGDGTIWGSGGLFCEAYQSCSVQVPVGSSVSLHALPAHNWHLSSWSGVCWGQGSTCSFSINSNTSVTGSFSFGSGNPCIPGEPCLEPQ